MIQMVWYKVVYAYRGGVDKWGMYPPDLEYTGSLDALLPKAKDCGLMYGADFMVVYRAENPRAIQTVWIPVGRWVNKKGNWYKDRKN